MSGIGLLANDRAPLYSLRERIPLVTNTKAKNDLGWKLVKGCSPITAGSVIQWKGT